MSPVVNGEPGQVATVADSVERDWQEFQRLGHMGNHWDRPGWAPGRRAYYWYITFDDTPQLEALAAECQAKLNLPYLDPVPLDRLHLTVQRLAFADEVTTSQVDAAVGCARQLLNTTEAFDLTIGPLAGSRGAVRFSVSPWAPIEGLRRDLREAISSSTEIQLSRSESDFRPHVGIAYCNARVPTFDHRSACLPVAAFASHSDAGRSGLIGVAGQDGPWLPLGAAGDPAPWPGRLTALICRRRSPGTGPAWGPGSVSQSVSMVTCAGRVSRPGCRVSRFGQWGWRHRRGSYGSLPSIIGPASPSPPWALASV